MNRKVQAVDPSSGVWLLGKVCNESVVDGTVLVKWRDYNEKTAVALFKTRHPEPKRKLLVENRHWPHFKHPSKLQRGDIVEINGTQTPLENSLNVEENDPFRGEITTSCGQLLKYEAISEGRVYSLSPSEVAEAGLALPTVAPPSTVVLHSTSKENTPTAQRKSRASGKENGTKRKKAPKQGGSKKQKTSESVDKASSKNKGNHEGETSRKSLKVAVTKQAANMLSIGGGGDVVHPSQADSFSYETVGLKEGMEYLASFLADLKEQGKKVTLASSFWPENQVAGSLSPAPDRSEPEALPLDSAPTQAGPEVAPSDPVCDHAAPDIAPDALDPVTHLGAPVPTPLDPAHDQAAPVTTPLDPAPNVAAPDASPAHNQAAPVTTPLDPAPNQAAPDAVPLNPVHDQAAPDALPLDPVSNLAAPGAIHPDPAHDQAALVTIPLDPAPNLAVPDAVPPNDQAAPVTLDLDPAPNWAAPDAIPSDPAHDQAAPIKLPLGTMCDPTDFQLDASFLDDLSLTAQPCKCSVELREFKKEMRAFQEGIVTELKIQRTEFKEEMRVFQEGVLAELKILREGLGFGSRPNQAPLQENDVLEVVNSGMAEKFKVRNSVIENLMPYNSDIPTVARKLADLVFSDGERRYGNVSGRKGKEMLNPHKVSAIRRAVLLLCPGDNPDDTWRKAVRAIDSASRYIRLKMEK